MGIIKNYSEYINEAWEDVDDSLDKKVAGVAIIYDNKILLVHPTNASWQKPTLGIPKGKVEDGEDVLTASLRELKEETGISLDASMLSNEPYVTDIYDNRGNVKKQLIYFVCNIDNLNALHMDRLIVDKSRLQIEEVDWAGFLGPDEAYPKMTAFQRIILDRHLKL
tara:strand:- start:14901 stop:15398 length:498 start_codon:yes stop_codon:yes gene_type:complete